ncbi:hypothetical protein C2G38_2151566 [Gigaspora rosea]|uniref:Uncharacterized protein n=1 Tax=Gigaspora rosea TaxID=44941 RepID=A0A397WCQ3_9GLOM|nr:hypothetical protein C2G38_2151566 [Gigaspora rosea]
MIDLLNNIIPSTLEIYATLFRSSLFNEYVENVFRIWTFALRWKRKNYNKDPLMFLSDLFYWNDNNHPFLNVIKNHLTSFNEYYVENTHSRIRANTSKNTTADNIIKQAYIIMDHDPVFKDTYAKTRRYPYNATTLDFLYKKTTLFLLQYFQDVFHNCGKSIPILNKKTTENAKKINLQKKAPPKNSTNKTSTKKTSTKKTPTKASAKASKKKSPEIYQLATLNEEVDLRYLPTAYSTSHPLHHELCDCCGLPLSNDNSMVYICSHGYHVACYNKKCKYCKEYYKRGIFENVNSFLKRIEKGENKLTKEDLDDDENDIEEGVDEVSEEVEEALDTSSKLAAEIYNIEHW